MNSKTIPFLIIAGIVLAGAIVWKITSKDQPKIISPAEPLTETQTTPPPVPTSKEEIVIEEYDKPLVEKQETKEEIMKKRARSSSLMKIAMQYKTADQAINALKVAKENNNSELAADLIYFIRNSYPNTSIPSDLLD